MFSYRTNCLIGNETIGAFANLAATDSAPDVGSEIGAGTHSFPMSAISAHQPSGETALTAGPARGRLRFGPVHLIKFSISASTGVGMLSTRRAEP